MDISLEESFLCWQMLTQTRSTVATGEIAVNKTMMNIPSPHNSMIDISQHGQRPNAPTTLSRVGQDKGAEYRASLASVQPASETKYTRAQSLNTESSRSQKLSRSAGKTMKVTLWVKPGVKAELERIAEQEGLSISKAGAAFLEQAVQQDIHTQHGALLETIITQAIGKGMRAYSNRIAMLLIRVAYDSGQTRGIVTNMLCRLPGVTPQLFNTIMDGSSKTAKRNITTRTPQIEAIIKELEALLAQERESE